jgi:predicted nucleic acid-binding protein
MLARITNLNPSDSLSICTITKGELPFGIERLPQGKKRESLRQKVDALLASVPCNSIPESAADEYARIKVASAGKGLPLDENDLWIAATAITLAATVVTRDGDFAQVDGLGIVNWTK